MPGRLNDEQREQVLHAVRIGVHPGVACTAAGLSKSYYGQLKYRARGGDVEAIEFSEAIDTAAAQSETADVEATSRATQPLESKPLECPTCGEQLSFEADELAFMVAKLTDVAKARGVAGEIALKKLERRHPKRWSQKIVHTVQEEHERLLDVCQRVLAPETFELLLEEYLAEGSGESEASVSTSEPTGGGVH